VGKLSTAIVGAAAGSAWYGLEDELKPDKSGLAGKLAKGALIGMGVYLAEESVDTYLANHPEKLEAVESFFAGRAPEIGAAIYKAGSLLKEIPREIAHFIDTPGGIFAAGIVLAGTAWYAARKMSSRRRRR